MKKDSNKFNAFKTGIYARGSLLPWENAAERERLSVGIRKSYQPVGTIEEGIVANIVENRWQRERQDQTTAIATHRHAFGLALEKSGAKTWPDALGIVREHNIGHENALQSLAVSMEQIAKNGIRVDEQRADAGEFKKLARKTANGVIRTYKILASIQTALDGEREFFREYWPNHIEQRIRVENSLDAQFDKLIGRLERVQEARILRDKLRSQGAASSSSPVVYDNVGVVSKVASAETPSDEDLADLDRDDT
jgi:hypothetical protein